MNLHAHGRRGTEEVLGRRRGARIAVALLATAALCLGPAVAAQADEATDAAAAAAPVEAVQPEVVQSEAAAPAEEPSVDAAAQDVAEAAPAAEVPAVVEEVAPAASETDAAPASEPAPDPAAESAEAPISADTPTSEDVGADEGVAGAPAPATLLAPSVQNKNDGGNGNTDTNGHQGITICHATSSDTNPYVVETPDADSMFRTNGHTTHTKAGGTRSDIIPAFWYVKNGNKHEYSLPGTGEYYPGKNLDIPGAEYMLAHDCNQPPEPEQPTIIAISAFGCLPAEEGASVLLQAVLGNLTDGESYTVTLTLAGQPVGEPDEFTADGDSAQWSRAVTSVGTYTITVTGPGDLSASTQSTVRGCDVPPEPPQVEVITGPCITPSDDVEAEIMLAPSTSTAEIFGTGLEPGESYWVSVTMGDWTVFEDQYEADENGAIYVEVDLSEAGTYTASISGPGEEGTTISQEFEIVECPPVPVYNPMLIASAVCTGGALQANLVASDLEPGSEYPVMVSGPAGFGWSDTLTASETGSATATVALSAAGDYSAELEGAPAVSFTVEKTCTPQVITPAAGPALPNTGSSDDQPLLWVGVLAMILAAGLMLEPVMARRMRR